MNELTKIKYNLARMYEYVNDVHTICKENDYDVDKILSNKVNRYAINMCIVQMGEHANRIKTLDEELYYDRNLSLFQIKGMRDRITHSYGNIDYNIIDGISKYGSVIRSVKFK